MRWTVSCCAAAAAASFSDRRLKLALLDSWNSQGCQSLCSLKSLPILKEQHGNIHYLVEPVSIHYWGVSFSAIEKNVVYSLWTRWSNSSGGMNKIKLNFQRLDVSQPEIEKAASSRRSGWRESNSSFLKSNFAFLNFIINYGGSSIFERGLGLGCGGVSGLWTRSSQSFIPWDQLDLQGVSKEGGKKEGEH